MPSGAERNLAPLPDQLDIFSAFDEARPHTWGARPEPPVTDLKAPQLPLITAEGLIPEGESGALARVITPHSLVKQDRVFRYANTVSVAMSRKWKIWWLDLFAGPGAVFDKGSSSFSDAIPLQVMRVGRPFAGYVFSDLSLDCVDSLRRRLGTRPGVTVEHGNANDLEYVESLLAPIPRDALVIAFLDPEGLDLHLETLRLLGWRFRHVDLLVNLPVQAIDRAISAEAVEPVKRVLEHPNPKELLAGRRTASNIRSYFKRQLGEMGFPPDLIVGNEIRSTGNQAPQYDLMLASRDRAASRLYQRANETSSDGQRGFELAC